MNTISKPKTSSSGESASEKRMLATIAKEKLETLSNHKKMKRKPLKNQSMNTGKILIGVLFGVAAGAALGMLFAPESGENTRKGLTKKGKDYLDELDNKYEDLLDSLTNMFAEAKAETSAYVSKAESKASDYKNNIQSKIQETVNLGS